MQGGKRFGAATRGLLLLSPLLLLAGAEILLRACGYGYPAGYFRPGAGPSGAALTGNPEFFRAFFPPRLEPYAEPFALANPKPDGTCRIFVLGESAALGIPDPSFGLPRVLERMLQARYPGTRFEVVGLAVTAVNSHVLLPMARAAAREKPDLFVLYLGNNEFIGPYGPGTVFAPFAANPSLIRASLVLKSLRAGQWLDARISPGPAAAAGRPEKWAGMEMFLDRSVPAGDARIETVYGNFRSNVDGILAAARNAGARAVVATMPVNRRDNAPFASRHRLGIAAADSATWRAQADTAAAMEAVGDSAGALAAWLEAIRIDSSMAEGQWRAARLLAASGRSAEADAAYQRAVDGDALRFRADSRINATLRAAARARAQAGDGVWLADLDNVFHAFANDADLFYEHVHLRFPGTWRAAASLMPWLDSALAAGGFAGNPFGMIPDSAGLRASLALTGWNELEMAKKIAAMAGKPPFTSRSDHPALTARLAGEVTALAPATSGESMQRALDTYQAALTAHPADEVLHRNLGELLYACDYLPQAAERLQAALALLPHDVRARQLLAKSLAEQGDPVGAEREFAAGLFYAPDAVELRNGLAMALAAQGRHADAERAYRRALEANPAWPEVHFNLARTLEALDRKREAMAELEAALRFDPGFTPAAREIGRLRNASGGGAP